MTSSKQDGDEGPPLIQWVVAGIGALLFVACVTTMIWFAVTEPERPPQLTVSADSVSTAGEGYVVTVTIRNGDGTTAANVIILGELMAGDSVVESSEFQVDYVPTQSRRAGGLFFLHDPRSYRLQLRALGYREP